MKSFAVKKPIFLSVLVGCIILVSGVFLISALGGCSASPTDWIAVEGAAEESCIYDLDLVLDPDQATLSGRMDFTYRNQEAAPMASLLFLLYPNSFEKAAYGAFVEADMGRAYPNGFSPGSISINSVTYKSEALSYEIKGTQNHELWVYLPEEIAPGNRTQLTIEYEVTIPNCHGRFGYGENTWSLVNCHPILAVYDGAYYNYPYYPMGDPFFSEVADYRANISVPESYEVAVTGHIDKVKKKNGIKIYAIDAPDRRDFGFVASTNFKVKEKTINGVAVRSYYFSSDAIGEHALNAGVDSINVFSTAYGAYPYRDFNVVQCDFFIGGMEYPGMVLIDASLYSIINAGVMEMIIAHETAHQWWYAQVGNDQVREPWLDEGLTDFSTALYYERNYKRSGDVMAQRYVYDNYDYMEQIVQSTAEGEYHIDAATTDYEDSYLYSLMTYGKGAELFKALREKLGDDIFFEALQNYLADYRYKIAEREDLENAFEKVSGLELTPWFDDKLIVSIGGEE